MWVAPAPRFFSWLLAKHNQARFVLRVEDTDLQRSTPEATQAILDGLTWLGLDWDDLKYQSQRTELHNEFIDRLLDSGQGLLVRVLGQRSGSHAGKGPRRGPQTQI